MQQPQFLASETAKRTASPADPFGGSLRIVMVVMGVLLIGTFVGPWASGGKTVFSWDVLSESTTAASGKFWIVMLAVGGLVGVLLGALPLPSKARGAGAFAAGAAVVTGTMLGVTSGEPGWRAYLVLVAMLLGPGAVLLRGKYPSDITSRLLGVVAILCVGAAFGIPGKIDGESIIPIKFLSTMLSEATSTGEKVAVYSLYGVFAGGLMAAVTFLPATATPKTGVLAWIMIGTAAFAAFGMIGAEPLFREGADAGKVLGERMGRVLFPPIEVLAGTALAAYGLATILGKNEA